MLQKSAEAYYILLHLSEASPESPALISVVSVAQVAQKAKTPKAALLNSTFFFFFEKNLRFIQTKFINR